MRNEKGQFMPGMRDFVPIGTIRIRTRKKRGGEQRRFIKIGKPNTWVLYAHYIWEQANGPKPRGAVIHHKDHDKLNDVLDNLEMTDKAGHLAHHRSEFREKAIANSIIAHRTIRWSTIRKWTDEEYIDAMTAYKNGEGTMVEITERFHLPKNIFCVKKWRYLLE